jgi:hypothetical protein
MLKYIFAVLMLALCGGASAASDNTAASPSEVRIDGSSADTVTASLHAMYAQHGNREKCLLETAILRIQLGDRDQKIASTGNKSAVPDPLGPKINGMTYGQVIALSEKYSAKVQGLCRD